MGWKDWIDLIVKVLAGFGGLGFFIAALSYKSQIRIKQAEWLKSLYEKFFESLIYKEARIWLDYGHLHGKLYVEDIAHREANEEKFTDFLNFFEFIGVLHFSGHLTFKQVNEVFGYYLKKIKDDADCQDWIQKYSFEKLKGLLEKIK
jgi:hypothetical protein